MRRFNLRRLGWARIVEAERSRRGHDIRLARQIDLYASQSPLEDLHDHRP